MRVDRAREAALDALDSGKARVAEPTAGGFPAISAGTGQFLLKDLVLLAASACLLLASIRTADA